MMFTCECLIHVLSKDLTPFLTSPPAGAGAGEFAGAGADEFAGTGTCVGADAGEFAGVGAGACAYARRSPVNASFMTTQDISLLTLLHHLQVQVQMQVQVNS